MTPGRATRASVNPSRFNERDAPSSLIRLHPATTTGITRELIHRVSSSRVRPRAREPPEDTAAAAASSKSSHPRPLLLTLDKRAMALPVTPCHTRTSSSREYTRRAGIGTRGHPSSLRTTKPLVTDEPGWSGAPAPAPLTPGRRRPIGIDAGRSTSSSNASRKRCTERGLTFRAECDTTGTDYDHSMTLYHQHRVRRSGSYNMLITAID